MSGNGARPVTTSVRRVGRPRQFTPEEARERKAAAQQRRRAPGTFQFIPYQPPVKHEPQLHGAAADIRSVPVQSSPAIQATDAIIPDEQLASGAPGHIGTGASDTTFHAHTHQGSGPDNTTFEVATILSSMRFQLPAQTGVGPFNLYRPRLICHCPTQSLILALLFRSVAELATPSR
jgi:hypothetical protein